MSELLDWLLGRQHTGASLVFDWALSPTGWAIALTLCVAAAWLSYQRLGAPAWARWTGLSLRAVALALIFALACGPRLVQTSERVEKDWVVVLADRSASMGVRDVPALSAASATSEAPSALAPTASPTRQEQLAGILARTAPSWSALASQRQVVWLGFDSAPYSLAASPQAPPNASTTPGQPTIPPELTATAPPSGTRTDLAAALAQALTISTARPLSGVVVLSDGQSTSAIPPAVVRAFQARAVGLYPLPLGSQGPVGDVALAELSAPSVAFAGDSVPVGVTLRATGQLDGPVRVELVDKATGRVLDAQPATFAGTQGTSTTRLTLVGSPPATAPDQQAANWSVRVVPQGTGDLLETNNQRDLVLRTVQRPLRLMYIDGYPRWEYRFLKNVLARERSVRFNATILSPGRRYIAEGAEDVFALPTTPQGWAQYDVIMIGDVQPGVFTPSQMAQLKDRVTTGGAGLIWIAGAGAVPSALAGTPLADLLPIQTGPASGPQRLSTWPTDVTLRPTPLADRLGVLRLADRQPDGSFWPAAISDPATGWSRLRWAQRIETPSLKPAAEVLATAHPVDLSAGAPDLSSPLVITMRYASGRVIYVATDELWRFRYGRGEELVERFYLQLIRLLGRESLARAGLAMRLELTPSRAEVGTPVRVSVELIDQTLVEAAPQSVTVSIDPQAPDPQAPDPSIPGTTPQEPSPPIELTLRPDLPSSPSLSGSAPARRTYVGTWVPSTPGLVTARVSAPLPPTDRSDDQAAQAITAAAEVVPPGDELATPQTDHELLASLARQTGGEVLDEAKLARLGTILPRREVRVVIPTTQATLWDRPSWLALLALLLTAEWIVRRLARLT